MTESFSSGDTGFSPDLESFETIYDAGRSQVIWTRLIADLETPVSAFLKLSQEAPLNNFLLESVEGGAVRGRYSVIGLRPDIIFRSNGEAAEINEDCLTGCDEFKNLKLPTLTAMRELLDRSTIDLPKELPPMSAGVFGYMAYDTVRLMEHLPDVNEDVLGVPDSIFVRPTIMVIFDAVKDEMVMVHRVDIKDGINASEAYKIAIDNLKSAILDLNAPVPHQAQIDLSEIKDGNLPFFEEPSSNTSPELYKEMVKKAQDYITEGDIFQVVLSQRFSAPFNLPPFALYRALRRTNPSPFLYFLNFTDFSVIGSSPEILVRARDEVVTVRPIAGTRPRGKTEAEDIALGEELLADPKECAEHLMLLDLGRNDVGRVSSAGSVTVTDQYFLERYSHVMHIVSNVEGKLAPEFDEIDALMAGFPAGTVSGAPKVRAMEIIDELEVHKRGVYAGCVGYFSANGEMDSCIVLRTAIVKDGVMHVQAGAGIVADSVPQSEFDECVNKAKALFSARSEALRFASIKRNN